MEKRKIHIDKNSMKSRLLTAILSMAFVLTLGMAFIGYKAFENTLISEIGKNREDVLSQIGERIRQMRSNVHTLSNLYYYDHTLNGYLEQLNESMDEKTYEEFQSYMASITHQFQSSFYNGDKGFQVVLALENGGGYASEDGTGQTVSDYMSPKTKIWYGDLLSEKGRIVDVASYKQVKGGPSSFCAARVMNNSSGETLAYLMVNMKETQIRDLYRYLTQENSNTIYVVDKGGNIISCSNSKLNGFHFFDMENLNGLFGGSDYIFTKMRGEDILLTRYYDSDSGFTVLEEISFKVLMKPIYRIRLILLLLSMSTMAVAAIVAGKVANRTTGSLTKLCDFMCQVDLESLDQECSIRDCTEINILGSRLNLMLKRMRDLMESIRQKEKQKRKMELGFLQAQINPHFMYNTLFSIKCMVDMEKNHEASQMLVSFIRLLRNTVSNPDEFVTLKHEFDMLKQYTTIQQFRYDNGFEVFFECDGAVENKKIPKLLIQPLLENAIFHGVEFKKGEGLIVITARAREGNVIVTVEDNGVGISEEILAKIERGERISEETHVGIVNVKDRIQLNFGENYGMKVESVQWKGTRIILTFPELD